MSHPNLIAFCLSCRALASYGVIQHMSAQVNQIGANTVELSPAPSSSSSSAAPLSLESDITILTTGIEPSPLVQSISTLKKDRFGRLLTSGSLQCLGHPNVFALGDCSSIQTYRDDPEKALPKTAQVAMQQSSLLAQNLYKRALKYPKKPWSQASEPKLDLHYKISQPGELDTFRYIPLGEMLSLGNTDGAISSLGGLVQISGPVASAARRLVYAARMPTNAQRVNAAVSAGVSTASSLFTKFLSKKF